MGLLSNQMRAGAAGAAGGGGGTIIYDYQIANSARFLGNSYLNKSNFGTATSTTKKMCFCVA